MGLANSLRSWSPGLLLRLALLLLPRLQLPCHLRVLLLLPLLLLPLMCALLLLIALLCHLSDRTVRGLLAAPAAAMFAKEQGILATPTLLAYAAMRTLMRKCTIEHFLRDARHLLLATLVVVVVKMYFLVGAMPHYDAIQNPAAHADSFLVRMLSHNYVVGRHFLLLPPRPR